MNTFAYPTRFPVQTAIRSAQSYQSWHRRWRLGTLVEAAGLSDHQMQQCRSESTVSTTTPIGRTGRFALRRRTQPPVRPSSATISRPKSAGVTCSAVCFTSTDELHERICAPYGSDGSDRYVADELVA